MAELEGVTKNAPAAAPQTKNGMPSPSLVAHFTSAFDSANPLNMSRHEVVVGGIFAALAHYGYVDVIRNRIPHFVPSRWNAWQDLATSVLIGWMAALASRYTTADEKILNLVYKDGSQ